jgi:hypothetical protein
VEPSSQRSQRGDAVDIVVDKPIDAQTRATWKVNTDPAPNHTRFLSVIVLGVDPLNPHDDYYPKKMLGDMGSTGSVPVQLSEVQIGDTIRIAVITVDARCAVSLQAALGGQLSKSPCKNGGSWDREPNFVDIIRRG